MQGQRWVGPQLFFCGMSALFWELALIRWYGSCIRIVAYFSNFVLLAAFFGLGAGALLARRTRRDLHPFLAPALAAAVLLGIALSGLVHGNPGGGLEFVWIGGPEGVNPLDLLRSGTLAFVPYWALLAVVYVANAGVFLLFGHYLGRLFSLLPPLRGYGIEVAGSLVGILAFAALSAAGTSPPVWFAVGFLCLLGALPWSRSTASAFGVTAALSVAGAFVFASPYRWSPYYRIEFEPLQRLTNPALGQEVHFSVPVGYTLVVNNDYHQMLLDLRERPGEPEFLAAWRWLYDQPYVNDASLPEGPILVVGAGTGNDVAAALRRTRRRVDAVEIDPEILELGRQFHPERPYQDPRVRVHLDDARSYFQRTRERYALVVFGFLDSHTLLSSFTSLRLDNFVYTRESMAAVRDLLLPGGAVYLTFASNTPWIHERLGKTLGEAFGVPVTVQRSPRGGWVNGVIYGVTSRAGGAPAAPAVATGGVEAATDDWPFLYLRSRTIPPHYRTFLVIVVTLGAGTLLLLPPGQRRVRAPYFLLGAAFFLLETSNVVSLSLLYGSTWTVNVVVFSGILALVLAGTAASALPRWETPPLWVFGLLLGSVALGALVRPGALLAVPEGLPRAAAAVAVFLSPVLFASLVFGTLIRREERFPEAYGSNVLGAVVGGALEYASMLSGFRALLLVTFVLYALAAVLLHRTRPARTDSQPGLVGP